MGNDVKLPDYKRPSDLDEVTPESVAMWLLQCVTHWQQANTVEERQQWEKETARIIRMLMPYRAPLL